MKRFAYAISIVMLALAGCGSDDDSVELKAVGSSAQTEEAAASNTTMTEPDAALAIEIDGLFIVVKGNGLYAFDPASGEAPQFITDQLEPLTINLAPEADKVIFDSDTPGDGQAFILNLPSIEPEVLDAVITTPAANAWGVASWSPDRQWVIGFVYPRGIEAIRVDGSGGFQLANNIDAFALWLNDGNILVVDRDFQPSVIVYRGIYYYDVATGEAEEWAMDEERLQTNFRGALQALVAEHGLDFADPIFDITGSVNIISPDNAFSFTNAADVCATWGLSRPLANPTNTDLFAQGGEEPAITYLYQAEGIHRITDALAVDGQTIYFLEWILPTCRISETPQITLKRLVIGEDGAVSAPEIIAEGVSAEVSYDFRSRLQGVTGRYSISPDGRFVAWAGGSAEIGTTSINVTDLTTLETITLVEEARGDVAETAFNENQLFRQVYWAMP